VILELIVVCSKMELTIFTSNSLSSKIFLISNFKRNSLQLELVDYNYLEPVEE